MKPRTIAIGDIHGCSAALDIDTLIGAIQPRQDVQTEEVWQGDREGNMRRI
jgi:hypothetical protein